MAEPDLPAALRFLHQMEASYEARVLEDTKEWVVVTTFRPAPDAPFQSIYTGPFTDPIEASRWAEVHLAEQEPEEESTVTVVPLIPPSYPRGT